MSAREKLRLLVEDLPEESLPSALQLIESLSSDEDSIRRLLESPEDDEAITAAESARLDRSAEESSQGKTRPWATVRESLI